MISEEQRRKTTTMKMGEVIEEMTYGEEGGYAADVVVEPIDKYHVNDDLKFRCAGEEEGGG